MAGAQKIGLASIAAPLFNVVPSPWLLPRTCDSLLIGSANVLRHGGDKLAQLVKIPAYAVGAKTAAAVKDAGLTLAFTGDDGLEQCAARLISDGHRHALRLTGRIHSHLRAREGLSIETAICYETRALALETSTVAALQNPCVIMAYSGAAIEAVEAQCGDAGIATNVHSLLAISARAAGHARSPWHSITTAPRPDDSAMLAQAQILCQ